MIDAIQNHAVKFGLGATLATLTIERLSAAASLCAGVLTCVCLVPVAINRWRKFLQK